MTKILTRSWPADHPGRNCGLCGQRVYGMWVDTVPPPGACVEDEDDAKMCALVRSRCKMNLLISRDQGMPMHERMTALMRRVGLTLADIEADLAHDKAHSEAHYELRYKTPATVGSKRLTDWLADGDREARFLVLVYEALNAIDYCDGKRTIVEIQERGKRLAKQVHALVIERLCHGEYESGESGDES